MVRPEGLEPPTLGSEGRCSIQLSYGRMRSCLYTSHQGPRQPGSYLFRVPLAVSISFYPLKVICSMSRFDQLGPSVWGIVAEAPVGLK